MDIIFDLPEYKSTICSNKKTDALLHQYINAYSKDDLSFLIKCKNYLLANTLIKNTFQYSTEWLNRSNHYFNVLKCKNIQPSIQVLNFLCKALKNECYVINPKEQETINGLNTLIDECQLRIANRMLKDFNKMPV